MQVKFETTLNVMKESVTLQSKYVSDFKEDLKVIQEDEIKGQIRMMSLKSNLKQSQQKVAKQHSLIHHSHPTIVIFSKNHLYTYHIEDMTTLLLGIPLCQVLVIKDLCQMNPH